MESMEDKSLSAKEELSLALGGETGRTIGMTNRGLKVTTEWVKVREKEEFIDAFSDVENFLDNSVAERFLAPLKSEPYKMRERFPEGTVVQLAAFPCDINGRLLKSDEMKNHAYFKIYYVDEKTGMAVGEGGLLPQTHAALLPQEMRTQCRFKVKYPENPKNADDDYEAFAAAFKTAFLNLRNLIKPVQK
jgi:hypothetical protein